MPAAILPALFTVGNAAARAASQRSQNRQAQRQYEDTRSQVQADEQRYREYQDMLRGALGGNQSIFGPQTSTTTGTQDMTSETMPVITPEFAPMVGKLRGLLERRLERGSALPPGYKEAQLRNIGESFRPQEQALKNLAAKRGMSAESLMVGSPVEREKAGKFGDLLASLPLTERQLQSEDIAQAQGAAAQFGKGERTRQHGTSSSSTTGPANAAAMLEYFKMLAPRESTIVQRPTTGSALGSGLEGGLQGALMGMQLDQMRRMFGGGRPPGSGFVPPPLGGGFQIPQLPPFNPGLPR